jgi:type VI secretion system protein ImpM
MRCSLFGKLAAKRDFIAVSAPRELLTAWEPWMQSCVSASRDRLGESWLPAYLSAPIWRFWLGREICGASVIGALMASLDGVGRYYPLTVFAYAEPDHPIAPPDLNPQEDWFLAAEAFLLSTLEREVAFESITEALERLAVPAAAATTLPDQDTPIIQDGIIGAALGKRSFSDLFALLRAANSTEIYAAASFWWTVGGGDCPPFGFCCQRMPDPLMFTTMLTGRISIPPHNES